MLFKGTAIAIKKHSNSNISSNEIIFNMKSCLVKVIDQTMVIAFTLIKYRGKNKFLGEMVLQAYWLLMMLNVFSFLF